MEKNLLKYGLLLIIAFIISGCTNTGNTYVIRGERLKNDALLSNKSSIYVVNGGDGIKKTYLSAFLGEEIAVGSGESAVNIEFSKLRERTPKVVLEKLVLPEDRAIEIAKMNQSDYLIYSRTERWTDPLGINCRLDYYYDEASVVISLYSIPEKKLLNTMRLENADCPSNINGMPVRPGSPENLFEKLFAQWLDYTFESKKN